MAAEYPVARATRLIHELEKKSLDVVSLGRPHSREDAADMAKVVSKLSAIMGNLLEFEFAAYLNEQGGWPKGTHWCRQDPEFPDLALLFEEHDAKKEERYLEGIEVKCWDPFATEMTGRFRESQRRLLKADVNVMVVAWLPEFIVYGKPKILATWSDKAIDIAKCRDAHYHDPPRYLVVEPEDTEARTRNLRQTNCAGYVFQSDERSDLFEKARMEVASWSGRRYSISPTYQAQIRQLMARYKYRIDTNFSKIDRIDHKPLEEFKESVLAKKLHGKTVAEWANLVAEMDEEAFDTMMELE